MDRNEDEFHQRLKAAARNEIEERSFALTRQLLDNQPLERENGVPLVTGIILDEDSGSAAVYFPVQNEYYFFVVYLDTEPEIKPRFMGMSPGTSVYCELSSETVDLDDLKRLLPIEPDRQRQKGSPRPIRSSASTGRTPPPYTFSALFVEPDKRRYADAEAKLESLLDLLERHAGHLPLPDALDVDAFIEIAYYGYKEEMNGIHLDAKTMRRLAALGLELDIDLYAGGPDLAE
ncbi:DUF4279 domain-containing protein [Saccharibacillus sp. CPCC 101409]|uniref:DUF4279 domain-containing protein n=1 Tax=Saccharibacillus sp. CPCC 101409 TaxID=3058041 RepID=UPI002671E9B6|nr:DUF4279 domain-containing protein [Saccharibacillus sp. CPCC 101409]MDO3412205.1 DUF4279 domain-containing protein [Saccharibacillus sp. CPCC 101409]